MTITCHDFARHRRWGYHETDDVRAWCVVCSPPDPPTSDSTHERMDADADEPKPKFDTLSPDIARLYQPEPLDPRNRKDPR